MGHQSDNKTTSERLEAIRERVDELSRDRTPALGVSSESSSRMYRIAEEVEARSEANRWVRCEERGPAARLARRIDLQDEILKGHTKFIDEYLGEQKFKRYVMPVLVGVLSGSAGVAIVTLLLRGALAASGKTLP